jgi:hypothetical protein
MAGQLAPAWMPLLGCGSSWCAKTKAAGWWWLGIGEERRVWEECLAMVPAEDGIGEGQAKMSSCWPVDWMAMSKSAGRFFKRHFERGRHKATIISMENNPTAHGHIIPGFSYSLLMASLSWLGRRLLLPFTILTDFLAHGNPRIAWANRWDGTPVNVYVQLLALFGWTIRKY